MITNIDLKNKEKNKGTLKQRENKGTLTLFWKQRDTHFVLKTKGHSLCFKEKGNKGTLTLF